MVEGPAYWPGKEQLICRFRSGVTLLGGTKEPHSPTTEQGAVVAPCPFTVLGDAMRYLSSTIFFDST